MGEEGGVGGTLFLGEVGRGGGGNSSVPSPPIFIKQRQCFKYKIQDYTKSGFCTLVDYPLDD